MAERNLNTTLKKRLINNEPFVYAHLIKYERPYPTLVSGKHSTDAKRYAYLTDGAVNIVFDDGSYATDGTTANGNQTYIADKIYKVGSYSETSQAKATGMTLELGAESLNNSTTSSGINFTTTTITVPTGIDLVAEGFREGDKVHIFNNTTTTGTLAADSGANGNHDKHVRITGIKTNNTVLIISNIDDTLVAEDSSDSFTIQIVSDELKGPLLEMDNDTLKSYHNRDVFIYKAFLDPDDYTIIGAPILIFKGIISSASLKEDPSKSMRVSWKLTSHWGDFAAVNGRWTNDAIHRALDNEGIPQPELALKEVYANDLGFQHSDITMHILATYTVIETKTEFKKKKSLFQKIFWGTGSSQVPYDVDVEVEREVDLNWALSAKYIPVVYGVDRVPAIPIFVDTKSTDANNIYIVYAIAEGEIGGIYDLYIEDEPLICSNLEDWDDRNLSGKDSSNADNSANDIDVVCRGRADKGETLGGETMSGNSVNGNWGANAWGGKKGFGRTGDYIADTIAYYKIEEDTKKNLNSALVDASDGSGVIDGQTISITKPNTMYLTFHSGKTDQLADNTLVTIAEGDKFKRQADYFSDTADEYWGPNHTLSDTAYVVMDCEITEGATTVPEVEYVVRGKYVDSYNYDFSYLHNSTVVIDDEGNESATNFNIGDTIELWKDVSGGSDVEINTGDTIVVIDKWTMYGPNGLETRFRFSHSPELSYSNGVPSITSFYMKKGNNTWYMVTYNHVQNSGTVPSALTGNATTTTSGQVPIITFASDPGWTTIFPTYKNVSNQLPIAFTNSARAYVDLSFPVTHSSGGTVLTMTGVTNAAGFVETGSYGEPVIRTDAIKLAANAASGVDDDDYYNGMTITLSIKNDSTGDTTEHVRKIIDYDEGTQTAQVDRVWDEGKEPERASGYTYTYKIDTPTDKRVSINPAMQLLDYITSQTYGKRLDINKDIALSDWLLSARTCDSRGTQTLTGTGINAAAEDRYILQKTDSSSITDEVIAMGRVQSAVSSSTTVVMEECFGKFSKTFMKNSHIYSAGDIIQTDTGYYKVGSAGTISTEPTHTSGTTNGLTFQSTVTLRKLGALGSTITLTNVSGTTYSDYTAYSIYNSDFVKFWRYLGWEDHNQRWVTRHQLCGVVDTANPVFDTINGFLGQFNGLLSYEAGLYVLRIETTSDDIDSAKTAESGYTMGVEKNVRYITNDDIIGSIKVTDPGPKKSYNTMTSTIGDPGSRFQGKQVSFYDSNFLKTDKMVIKSGSHTQPAVHSYFNARINVENALKKSRFGMKITFKLGPKALLLLAGETIGITYDKFEWSSKKFRISNITFNTDCTASITATEYDDSFYTISPPKLPSLINDDVRTSVASVLGTPNNLDADAVTMGNIDLTWINGINVAPANTTEIWMSSSTNDRTKATLLAEVPCTSSVERKVTARAGAPSTGFTLDSGNDVLIGQLVTGTGISGTVTVATISGTALTLSSAQTIAVGTYLTFDNTGSYQHGIGENLRTRYYWIRHKKITSNNIPRYSGWHPTGATAGVSATSTIPEIFYSVTVTSDAQIFNADSDEVIQTPNYIKFTATKNSLSGAFVWSTSPSVTLYNAATDGSTTTSGTSVWLRKGDFSGTSVAVTATVTSSGPERTAGADNTYFETVTIPRVDAGTDATGADAKLVRIRSSSYIFKEAIDGTVTPAYIKLDAVKQNTSATATWAVTDDSPSVELYDAATGGSTTTTGDTVYMRRGTQTGGFGANTAVTVTLTCDSIVDTTNIIRLEENSGNIIAVLSNPAHVLKADSDGAVSNAQAAGSGTNIRVYEGTTALTFVTGTPSTGEWALSVGNTDDIVEGGITDQGTYATIGNHTGVTTGTDTYTITYTISGKTRKADSFTNFTIDQYLTKAKTGAAGSIGLSNAIVYLYKLHSSSSSAPTLPDSGSSTYTFATKALTETTSGDWDNWVKDIPTKTTANPYVWITAATASGSGDDDTIPYGEWVTPVLYSAEGYQTATVYLYQRTSSATSPAVINNDTTYTFSTKALSGSLDSWSQTIPTSGGDYIHVTTAVALAINSATTDTIVTGDWSTSTTLAQKGDSGLNQSTVSLYYLNNDSSSVPAHPDTDLVYNFANKALTVSDGHATLDSWTQAFPDTTSSLGVRWVTMAVASANSGTDTIAVADWADPVVIGDDKNIRNAQVDLYQRSSTTSAPADPNGNLTYTFATGVLSGSNFNSWTVEIPATGNDYIFKISAVALGNANATTDTIATGDWSDASLIGVPGQGAKYASLYKLNDSTITTNNFGTFADPTSGAELGWTIAVPDIGTVDDNTIYVTTRTFTSDGAAPQTSTWTSPVVHSKYTKGATGRKVAELTLYQPYTFNNSTTSVPTTPTSGTYNFSTKVVASPNPNSWSQTEPAAQEGVFIFQSETLATESSGGTTSDALTWSSPSVKGYPGNDINFIFRRDTVTSTPADTNYGASLPSSGGQWYDNIADVPAGSNSIWVSKGIVKWSLSGSTYSYKWDWEASSQIEGSDGAAGAVGKRSAEGILYATAAGYSTAPNMTTYTFSTKAFTGGNNAANWTLTPPALAGLTVNTWYQVNYNVTETTSAGGTGTPAFGTPTVRVSGFGDTVVLDEDELDIEEMLDGGNTKTYAGYAGTGLRSDGYIQTGIYSGGAVSVADMKDAKVRSFTGLTGSGILNTTVPEAKGGTGLTAAGNAIVNSRVKPNADGTFSYDNTTTGAMTMNTIADANNVRSRITAGLATSGNVSRAVPEAVGGTGLTSAGNAIVNSRVKPNADGTLSYDNTTTGAMTMNTIADANNIRSRITAGLATSGNVSRAVPEAVGGTGLTSNATLLNSAISLSAAGALSGAGGGTITKAAVGIPTVFRQDGIPTSILEGDLWVDTNDNLKTYIAEAAGANEITSGEWVLQGPGKDIGALSEGTVATARGGTGAANLNALENTRIQTNTDGTLDYLASGSGAVTMNTLTDAGSIRSRITTGLTSSGIVDEAVPALKGGTGETNTNKFLNSDLGVTLSGTTLTLTKAGDTNSTDTVPTTLKNATIGINTTTGIISGIGAGTDSRVYNDLIGVSIATSGSNQGRITVAGIGSSNTTVDVTKGNLGLDYEDGSTDGATWGTNLGSRPTELTDGRITDGLNSDGKLISAIRSGSTDFTVAEAVAIRGGFDDLSSTPILKTTNANTALRNSGITLNSSGTLSGGGTSQQVNIGSVAGSNFDTSGNVSDGKTLTISGSADNAKGTIVVGNITIDGYNNYILITD